MIDIDPFRADPARLDAHLHARGVLPESVPLLAVAHLHARGVLPESVPLLAVDRMRREAAQALQEVQERRNALAREIAAAGRAGDRRTVQALKAEATTLKADLPRFEEEYRRADAALTAVASTIPNLLADDVPPGTDESQNVVVTVHEATQPRMPEGRDHVAIGTDLGMMDFETATQIAGSRFVILSGPLARLERALGQFMLDLHTEQHGYREVAPPLIVKANALFGTGQLPKFGADLYTIESDVDGEFHPMLIPTAEVPLTNLVAGKRLDADALPLRYTALTPCFRSEAGSAGRDTRGMLRQHQFMKCELVAITTPDQSEAEHTRMLGHAEAVLQALDLPYRVVKLCAGDTGFSAARTYDLEVWLPSSATYREISSVSTCRDFQGRRMDARVRHEGKLVPVHTLNGSGVAVGRALLAIMENYQCRGGFMIPKVLQPYMGGLAFITL